MGNSMTMLYASLFLKGILVTLAATCLAGIISLILGTVLGIVSSYYIGLIRIRRIIQMYTFLCKGIPCYVQILIAYFMLPAILGINVSGFVAAVCALAICSSGYVTEIIRSSINAIDKGQWDASFVLGYSLPKTLLYIILPQMLRNGLLPLLGELQQVMQGTCLLATVGVTELTRVGMNIISRDLNPLPIYTIIAFFYLLLGGLLQLVMICVERKIKHGNR